jgi:hypothetical protein
MNTTFTQMLAVWYINMYNWCLKKGVLNQTHKEHYNQRAEFYHQKFINLQTTIQK